MKKGWSSVREDMMKREKKGKTKWKVKKEGNKPTDKDMAGNKEIFQRG